MMKQIGKMMLLFALLIPAGTMAQDNEQAIQMTVSNTQRNGHAQFLDAIMIYQSFSGDADSGNITNAAGNSVSTETGTVNVTLGNDCTWTLTADTYITSLKGNASHIKANGHRLFVNGKEMKISQ